MKNVMLLIAVFLFSGTMKSQELVGTYDMSTNEFTVLNNSLLQSLLAVELPEDANVGEYQHKFDPNTNVLLVWVAIESDETDISSVSILLKYNPDDNTVKFIRDAGPGIKIKIICKSEGCKTCIPSFRGFTAGAHGAILWPTLSCDCWDQINDKCTAESEVTINIGF